MTDLTTTISHALNQNVTWRPNKFYDIMDIISSGGYKVSFWEGEENWATFGDNQSTQGYLWSKYPLILVQSNFSLKEQLESFIYLTVIAVDDLCDPKFAMDSQLASTYFYGLLSFNQFSAVDLWFYTVT